ncbi:hypothetical protein EDB19DRAFT_1906491 [Suillus lakei]|nr:hypothetical protein EDB19DRAFT_1906491 [Suillus lakei]
MFCNLKQVIQMCLLLEQEEAAKDGDGTEEEHIKAACRKILDGCDDLTHARYKRTFEYITEHAPYLGTLIGRRKKRKELMQLVGKLSITVEHQALKPVQAVLQNHHKPDLALQACSVFFIRIM